MFIYRCHIHPCLPVWYLSFHPPPLLWEVKGRSKGQLARVCLSPPSPPNLYDHQTVGYKGQVNSKFEHSRVILRGGAITLHLFLPVSVGKTIIMPLCTVILLLTFYAMQLSRHSPLWVQEVCSPIPSDVPMVIWHMGDGFFKKNTSQQSNSFRNT